jgi:two-component system cell cycle sensor histidine kinase/response regulator CckA
VCLLGLLGLLGWVFDSDVLKSGIPGLIAMKANAALGLTLAGLAILLLMPAAPGSPAKATWSPRVGRVCAALVGLIGLLTLAEQVMGWNLGIDQLVFQDPARPAGTYFPGRMAPLTAVNLLLMGAAFLLPEKDDASRQRFQASEWLLLIVASTSLLVTLEYLFGVAAFFNAQDYSTMAINTAIALLLLAAAGLLARPHQKLVAMLGVESAGGTLARRLLPAAVMVPVTVAYLGLLGENAGLFSAKAGLAIHALASILILCVLTWITAKALDNVDAERRRSEQALRQAEAKYRSIFDHALDGLYQATPEGIFIAANPAMARILGYASAEDLMAQLTDVASLTYFESGGRARFLERLERDGVVQGLEHEILRRDSSRRWVIESARAVRNAEGVIQYYEGLLSDVAERKRIEDQLREQAELLDHAQDAIFVRDLQHRITYWNKSAERLYGRTAAEAAGRSVLEFLYKDPAPFLDANDTLTRDGQWAGELRHLNKAGREVPVESRWTLVRDRSGAPRSVLSINTDISERKKMEQQFFRTQRLESIGILAGGIAHDLNNVLGPIVMSIDLLKVTAADDDSRSLLETISSSAQRGKDMVGQVLSFARGVEGRRIDVQVRHLIRDMGKIARETFPKNIRIRTTMSADLWIVQGDPTQLHQVLLNLCINARDAMPDGGRIAITAENVELDQRFAAANPEAKAGPYVAIEVEDTGTGIPQEIIDKIFDPFFTTKEIGKGTGLGLSTSLSIVQSHGGFLRVSSEPGKGTRFRLCLPAQPDSREQHAETVEVAASFPRGDGRTVLVVDDDPSMREVSRRVLEGYGYRVMLARDGAEAVTLYAQSMGEISLVIVDMMMPVMDGSTAIQALLRMNPAIRVIAVSGIAANAATLPRSEAGTVHFLAKPYSSETLLKAMSDVLPQAAG